MEFASDNAGPVPSQVLETLAKANKGYASGYGADALSERVTARLRDLFEAPQAAVYLVSTGTAANSIALSCLCPPFGTVFCSPVAHIHEDECNAPEFYTGGAKLTLVPGTDRMDAGTLHDTIAAEESRGVHGPQRGPVSITQVTERGNVYSLDQLRALCDVARAFDLPVHLDGARFANACVKLGCTPAEMSWKLGVDAVVFGGTKNGLMGVEAVVFFDPAKAVQFEHRRKRGGHLISKHRYLAAQMEAYLEGDLWMDLATRANRACERVVQGLKGAGVEVLNDTWANMLFFRAPRRVHRVLQGAGAHYYLWDGGLDGPDDTLVMGRLVCDWSLAEESIDGFLEQVRSMT